MINPYYSADLNPYYSGDFKWEKLDDIIKAAEKRDNRTIWKEIKHRPLDEESIELLVSDGWTLRVINSTNGEGYCHFIDKQILLANGLYGYERDKVFFHELAHAHFGQEINDGMGSIANYRGENNAIAEWVGRKVRADPRVLRKAILSFGLQPHIYDKSSYEAFHKTNKHSYNTDQLALPFNIELTSKPIHPTFQHVLMD